MVLVPMDDGREWYFRKFVDGEASTLTAKTNFLGGIANGEQRNAIARFPGELTQGFQVIVPPKMFGHNAKARGAAVHGVGLQVMWKFWHR